ncbi:MAG TPA: hypothetical protein VLM39_02930 [Ignavibacteriaceae bacterium]|nr:hypothetical protein [Ignavibacteriaceae bacterium]
MGELIWTAVVAGLIGTGGMVMALRAITKSGWANADMVRALGSLFTHTIDNSFGIGIVVHFTSGIIFAFLYCLAITAFNVHNVLLTTASGVLIGFIHGGVVGFLLVTAVAEHHPLPQFKKAEFSVGVAHWIGHVVYGFLVGFVYGLMRL